METVFHYVASPTRCGYLPDRSWSLEYEFVSDMSKGEYLARMLDNWRRFGGMLFRPACAGCNACRSIRVPVARFRPDRGQRRCSAAIGDRITLRIGEPNITRAKLNLYDRYHAYQTTFKGWPQHPAKDVNSYAESFVHHPFATEEWCYYLDDRLVAVGYVDVLPGLPESAEAVGGLSAIYFFYDPQERRWSLGTWNVLCIIAAAVRRGLPYAYLGYHVEGCRSMDYKARFRPNQRRGEDGIWRDYLS